MQRDMMAEEVRVALATVRRVEEQLQAALTRLEAVLGLRLWYPLYGQRDARWRGRPLGVGGGETLGSAGCAVTCAAMQATAVGCETTPGSLNEWLKGNDGFIDGNQLQWGAMEGFCPLLEWRGRENWRDAPADVGALRRVMEQGPVVVEVDFDYRDLDVDQHFVVAVEWLGEDALLVADPWDGALVDLAQRYLNPAWATPKGRVARVVTGMRMLQARLL